MGEYYQKHFQEYFKEHPGEYVLIEQDNNFNLKVSFFKKEGELEKAISKYAGLIGPTIFTERIPPSNTHRFNKNNHTFYFTDKHIKYCPNDIKREMPLPESHADSASSDKKIKEHLYCKDCGCFIKRKPSKKAIAKWKKEMENMLIGSNSSEGHRQFYRKDVINFLEKCHKFKRDSEKTIDRNIESCL